MKKNNISKITKEKPKPVKKKANPINNAPRAKQLAKQGLNTKEIGSILGISKYDASKLVKR